MTAVSDESGETLAHLFVTKCKRCDTQYLIVGPDGLNGVGNVCSAIFHHSVCKGQLEDTPATPDNRGVMLGLLDSLVDLVRYHL